jgi:SAM-dependent methyltransferase
VSPDRSLTAHADTPPVAEPDWLDLREPADRRSRSAELAHELAAVLGPGPVGILDIGCGSGATTRWLAPLLPGPQEWVLLDRDPALLALVPERTAGVRDRDGTPVARTTRHADIAALTARDLAATGAVTASALVDLLTATEIDGLAATCAAARVPALLTLTVTGRVEIEPSDPLDGEVAAAFDAHQRRTVDGRPLLGPDAAVATVDAFRRHGMTVRIAETPWRLGAEDRALISRWLTERVAAAVEQRPDLRGRAVAALHRRVNSAPLRAVIYHVDLLALPNGGPT